MKRYLSFNDYLKGRFDCKVYKISVDAGFTCPNRDGSISSLGCIYCDETGSRASYCDKDLSIKDQVLKGMEFTEKRYGAKKFIVYFQAFTNTYAAPAELKKLYDQALVSDEIIGISIGTRPDCVTDEILDIIEPYAKKYDVWIELGVQSLNDKTLDTIDRGHSSADSLNAIALIKGRKGIKACAHIIIGLPGETDADWIDTAKKLSGAGIDGLKIHALHVLKNTTLEKLYSEGKIKLLEMSQYVSAVCDVLENIRPDIVIQRICGDAPASRLVAPMWINGKTKILKMVDEEIPKRNDK